MKNFDDVMKQHGATEKQLRSKTADILLSAIAEETGFLEQCSRESVERMKSEIDTIEKRQRKVLDMSKNLEKKALERESTLKNLIESSSSVADMGRKVVLQDPVALEALNLYRSFLETTFSVMEENHVDVSVSPELPVRAIEAGISAARAYIECSSRSEGR